MLKKLAIVVGLVLLFVYGAYRYYLYSPAPDIPALSGKLVTQSFEHDGLTRSYLAYIPAGLPSRAPMVFVLHGSIGSGELMRNMTAAEFDELADERGFIAVYPDGYDRHWNDCRRSADYKANLQNVDDVGFLAAIIRQLAQRHQANPEQAYVTGISNGGHMAYRLALESPGQFAAYAPMAANLPAKSNLGCQESGRAVSIAIFNGTNDPINPYNGGTVSILGNDSRGEVLSSEQTAAYWQRLGGLSGAAGITRHPELDGDQDTWVVEQRWSAPGKAEVRLYTLHGSGHVVPSTRVGAPRLLGGAAGDLSGPATVVGFFLGDGR